jgi:hypothetical protein
MNNAEKREKRQSQPAAVVAGKGQRKHRKTTRRNATRPDTRRRRPLYPKRERERGEEGVSIPVRLLLLLSVFFSATTDPLLPPPFIS